MFYVFVSGKQSHTILSSLAYARGADERCHPLRERDLMEIPAKSDPNWPSIVGTEATGHYGRSILGADVERGTKLPHLHLLPE